MAGKSTQLGSASIPIRATLDQLDQDLAQAKDKVEKASGGIFSSLSKVGGAAILGGIGLAAGAIAGIGAAAINAREQLDEAYDTIISKTGATGEVLEGLHQDFREVFTSVPTDAGRASEVIAELNAKLGITGQELRDLSRPLLEATRLMGGDAKTNAGLLSRVVGDWGLSNEEAAGALDKVFVAAQKSGIGMDQLMTKVVGFGSPMRLMGFTLDDTIALFSKWEKEGVNAELVMGSLRIAAGTFADAGKPLRESLMDTFDSIQNNTDATAALSLGMSVFGARAGPDMTAAIREGRFEIEDMVKALQGADGAIMSTSEELEGFEEKFEKLKNKALVALEPIGTAIMEGIGAKVLDAAIPALESLVGFIDVKLTPAVEAASAVVGKLLEGDWAGASADIETLFETIDFGKILDDFNEFLTGPTGVATMAGNLLGELIEGISEKIVELDLGGVVAGTLAGAIAGGILGGPFGAVVGAAMGAGITSWAGSEEAEEQMGFLGRYLAQRLIGLFGEELADEDSIDKTTDALAVHIAKAILGIPANIADLFGEVVMGFAYETTKGRTIPEEMTFETFEAQRKRDLQDMMSWLWEPPEVTPEQTRTAAAYMDAILAAQTARIREDPGQLSDAVIDAWNTALQMSAESPPAEATIMGMYQEWSNTVTQGVADSLVDQMQLRSSYISEQAASYMGLPMMEGFQEEAEAEMPTVLSNIVEATKLSMESTISPAFAGYGDENMAGPLVSGFEGGLSRRQQVIRDAINSYLINPMLQGAEEALGIHSPSTVFARLGRLSMEGFSLGLQERAQMVKQSAVSALEVTVRGVEGMSERNYNLTYHAYRPEPGRLDAAAAMRELELYGRLVS
ncbi:MAG TPA: phage tail tape measure protein [Anaerolineae bacterium]|nr:phage tail tape measure protein [Anaerolineae bacterium]